MKHAFATVLILLLASPSWAGDLAKAKLLYENRLLDDAKRELIEIVSSNTRSNETAAALHLLGTIAAEEERYDSAIQTWNDLIARFPNSQDALEAKGKLPLVRTLRNKAESQVASPHSSVAGTGSVIVAGIGTETEFVTQAVTEFMNLLASRGVTVTRASAGTTSVPELLRQTGPGQAKGVLVLALRFGYMENLRAMCHGPDGQLLWEEKASGSMGFTKSGITQGLIERVSRKIEPHIGGTCLPTH